MNRTRRDLLGLFLISLSVRVIVAVFVHRPGYMDPAYYAAGAVHLARTGSLTEPFLWNYLDDPAGLPHPGFLYWMPLPSLLAAPFAALFPGSFLALQLPFVFLSALLPLVGYVVAWQTTAVRRRAWVAGLLTLFSGFFFPYWTLPETFAPFALFGSVALWLAGAQERWWASCLAGLLVGLAHLTRADGILLLPVVALAPLFLFSSRNAQRTARLTIRHWLFVILGYLLSMGPWFVRNLVVIGAPLSPAGTRTLWLTNYDDLFCYGCDLSLRSYLAWGWGNILRSKLWALGVNAERFLAEDCLIFLLPFVFIGLYRLRRRPAFALSAVYLLLAFLAHSLAFTFPGPRGGFFHASAAVLPFLFAAGAEGVEAVVRWAARRRRWNRRQAQIVFSAAAVMAAMVLSVYVAAAKLPSWRRVDAAYLKVCAWLDEHDAPDDTIVLVGNPPAFWYHTRRPALVIPNDDVETLLAVADRYGAGYMVLGRNRPVPLGELCAGETRYSRLQPVATWREGEVILYRVMPAP